MKSSNSDEIFEMAPWKFYLSQNYPNPFRKKTIIKYCVAYKTKVKLTVYSSEGKEIERLVDEEKNPGTYEVEFNAVETGHAPSLQIGTYLYRLEATPILPGGRQVGGQAGDYKSEKKMEIIK